MGILEKDYLELLGRIRKLEKFVDNLREALFWTATEDNALGSLRAELKHVEEGYEGSD